MTKKTITISVDVENAEWARKNLKNISGDINEYLERCRNIHDGDIDGVNIEILKLDKAKADRKVLHWQSKLKALEIKIAQFIEIQEKKEKEHLKKEKEEIERQETCQNCGSKVTQKWNDFSIGKICQSCYRSADAKQIGEWMKKR